MIPVGVHIVNITPPAGQRMCGFAARSEPALGAHDMLTVRALAVGDTALVTVDVIGISQDASQRIRRKCPLPASHVTIHATHTHGGPVSMVGRLGSDADPAYLRRLEAACVEAIEGAVRKQVPATLFHGDGEDPGVARNRRHADGPVDPGLPVLIVKDAAGKVIAQLVNYACHPVVLGADNRLWTGDYPHFVRKVLEAHYPGSAALFLTGCAGDLNTGHSAQASLSLAAQEGRNFASAEAVGARIAAAALAANLNPSSSAVSSSEASVSIGFERRESRSPEALAEQWSEESLTADPVRKTLLNHWVSWANTVATQPLGNLDLRVTCLSWGDVAIVGMPGEIFAASGLWLRGCFSDAGLFLGGFCDDNPGYIPPRAEYAFGGYEVDEAHRYYGQPAGFSPGSAEAIAAVAKTLLREHLS